jgi:cystathionine beta-lyase
MGKKRYNFDELIPRENTDCVKYDRRGAYFGTEDVIPLWVADMDFRTPDFIMEALRKRLDHEVLGYTVRGKSFDEAIIYWLKNRHGWEIQRDWINYSPGVVPALSMAVIAFTEPGDKIVVQPPVYFPFYEVIKGNHRQIVCNPLVLKEGRYTMDLEDLRRRIDPHTKMLILSSPHNPGGSLWSTDELWQLARICLENNTLILADEIHSDLVLNGSRFVPMATLSEEIARNTLTFMAPSKTFNIAGLTTSFLIASNPEIMKTFSHVQDTMHLFFGNLLGYRALEAAYTLGGDWLDQLIGYLKGNLDLLVDFVNNKIPMVKVVRPEATYMAWLDFRELGMNDKELREFLIRKAKVGLNDGPTFGTGGSGFQRLNFACPRSMLHEALERIRGAVFHEV